MIAPVTLSAVEAASFHDAAAQAYDVLGELDAGLSFLHLILTEGDHASHLGLEATVALWSRALRSVLSDKANALEALIATLKPKEDAA